MKTDGGIDHSRLLYLLDYRADSGKFYWNRDRSLKTKAGDLAGIRRPDGRVRITVDYTKYLAHRLAWFYVHGEWPVGEIDHINRDPSDNRILNLREADRRCNQQNISRPQANNKSGSRGVSYCSRSNRWLAQIKTPKCGIVRLGYFTNIHSAEEAYRRASIDEFGAFSPFIL